MKGKINAELANGKFVEIAVDVNVNAVRFTEAEELKKLINSKELYGEVNGLFKKEFGKLVPEYSLLNISLKIISNDLEKLMAAGAAFESGSLALLIIKSAILYLLDEESVKYKYPEFELTRNITAFLDILGVKEDLVKLLKKKTDSGTDVKSNSLILKLSYQIENRDYKQAEQTRELIKKYTLSSAEKKEFDREELKLFYHLDSESHDSIKARYDVITKTYSYDKSYILSVKLDFIKYLEDNRMFKEVDAEFKLLLENYSEKDIEENSGYYYYLKGRREYHNGEFVKALDDLYKAYNNAGDEIFKADILNTSANCFSDTMYLEFAETLAEKAFEIRSKYMPAKKYDTLGLMGYIKFRKGDFENAFEYYSQSLLEQIAMKIPLSEMNRTYNSLAKVCMFLRRYDEALSYLDQGIKDYDLLSSKYKSYSSFYYLLFYYYTNDNELFNSKFKEFADPGNYRTYDKFALGWAFCYKALSEYKHGQILSGNSFLYESINFFTEDRYYVEAIYVWLYSLKYSDKKNPLNAEPEIFTNFLNFIETYLNKENFKFLDLFPGINTNTELEYFYKEFLKLNKPMNKKTLDKIVSGILDKYHLM